MRRASRSPSRRGRDEREHGALLQRGGYSAPSKGVRSRIFWIEFLALLPGGARVSPPVRRCVATSVLRPAAPENEVACSTRSRRFAPDNRLCGRRSPPGSVRLQPMGDRAMTGLAAARVLLWWPPPLSSCGAATAFLAAPVPLFLAVAGAFLSRHSRLARLRGFFGHRAGFPRLRRLLGCALSGSRLRCSHVWLPPDRAPTHCP